ESMAPRFGDVTGDDARTKEADAHWSESFTGQRTEGSRRGLSGLSRALGAVLPIVVLLIIGFAFAKVFGSGGLHGFSAWWIFMFLRLPFLNRLIRRIRKHLDDCRPSLGGQAVGRPVGGGGEDPGIHGVPPHQ